FGVFTVIGAFVLLPSNYSSSGVWIGLFLGYLVGLVYAVVNFSLKGGPEPGDWWVAPAASCCLILVAASLARMKPAKA
ncbi:hypothetical protein, partial [Arthrobacter sp. 35/47]|uniref:hypothetical protein n=1 Tax=Arthrobacter sp. 35/47 TaxID=269454 RepID=UPI001C1DD0E8